MFAQLPMYQRQGASAYKIDLTNTIELAKYLNNPESKFKTVHVGGTNGKGSTSHMLASILQEAGYKVGLYTSPHLKDFRERIRVDGTVISESYVVDFMNEHKAHFESNQLSFFEMTVGLAFKYFADSEVDIAIIEVGLGGRLDSTNIIVPEVSVITNIGLDHASFLGNTLAKIASEKAGIIKKNIPVVIGRTTPETKEVFIKKATSSQSEVFFAKNYRGEVFDTDLLGNYQKENVQTAVQTILILNGKGWNVDDNEIRNGLSNVVLNTGLLGRWQILNENPKVICDTAHNEDGLKSVINQLLQEEYDTLHVVLGVVNDKDLDTILPLFPKDAVYYFTKPAMKRGLDECILKKKALRLRLEGDSYPTVYKAYQAALQRARNGDVIYVGGSTFVVAEII